MLTEVRKSLYNRENKTKLNILLNVLIVLVIFVLVFEIYFMTNYSGVYVDGESMECTLVDGDYVYIDKHAKPDYGDIVVVYLNSEEKYIIKRAVAFGGDRVKIVDGQLQIMYSGTKEFVKIEETYLSDDHNKIKDSYPYDKDGKFISDGEEVDDGCIFLLGDNRDNSFDSRKFGSLPMENLDGVVTKWSLEHKSFCTKFYNFFKVKLPAFFKLK